MPVSASRPRTSVARFTEISTPSAMPAAMPSTPIRLPWTMNTDRMLRGVAPSVRRIAMSRRLSFTTMTIVETTLNAATATTSERITNMMCFVIWIERKKFACCPVQSST